MFLNLENGQIKLYDLRMYKKLQVVKRKMVYDSPYEEFVEKEFVNPFSCFLYPYPRKEEEYYIDKINSTYIGKQELNDFECTVLEIYESVFRKYQLSDVYLLLYALELKNYSKLTDLNQYINGKMKKEQQTIFEKYRKDILNNIKLVELLSEDQSCFIDFYRQAIRKSKGRLHDSLENINCHIYEMDVSSIPKLIKSR